MYPPFRYWRPDAVNGIMEGAPLNVYLHTPYCIQRCSYCFYKVTKVGGNRQTEIDRYVDALCREIEIGAKHFNLKDRPTISIYMGGGTPTLLTGKNLHRIMETLHKHLTLTDPEIVFEAEPVTLNPKKAAVLKELGVNRISLGIQSFSDEIIAQTGRVDTEKKILRAIDIAKNTGALVTIDLLSGLAGETAETWEHSIDKAISVDVNAVTIYKMELYANSHYYSDIKRGDISLPTDEEEIGFMRYAQNRLKEANYLPTTFFTFGKDGKYGQRHIISKWQGVDTYAFGVSAFGTIDRAAYQNTSEISAYVQAVEKGKLPIYRGYLLNSAETMYRDLVLGLKPVHLNHRDFKRKHGIDLTQVCAPTLQELKRRDLVCVDVDNISLTDEGILWGDSVGNALLACLKSRLGA
jgi:oxygen-independent coproporphyrinogen-3 oxidase